MSDNFIHKTSILMIYCTYSANVQMFDISDIDCLINNLDIQLFNMLILLLKLIFSDVFMLWLWFWTSVSLKHDFFLLYFLLLIIISSWLSASIQNCTSLAFFNFFISSLSACSLWLWHYLDAVYMLSYM